MISSQTHSMNILKKLNGIALVEITEDEATAQRPARFYVVSYSESTGQIYSAIPADCPASGRWFAKFTPSGVSYVANGRTRQTAVRWFNRLANEN